ncbi:MAG: hypothetical protein A3G96_05195 [Gammaproteobacteria bacterium RIFCSPLOWO2_12_FULL_52_10]|nr:MAG: hypothetical protein A3G96_05195 [Gammaproteobacteria bacterium RIFCSPLOWO2_12_FULL_52_10]
MKPDKFTLHYMESHPEDAASSLEGINHEDMCEFIASLPVRHAALVIQHLTPISSTSALARLPLDIVIPILSRLPANQASALIRRLPAEKISEITSLPGLSGYIKRSLRYPPDTVGAIMDTDNLVLPVRFTISESRKHMKKHTAKIQNRIFVTDEQQQLKGFVELKEIMFANYKVALSQLVRRPNIKLSVRDRLEAIAADTVMQQTEIFPVVDHTNRLMGVVTNKDLQQAIAELSGNTITAGAVTNDFLEILDVIGNTCSDLLSNKNDVNAG